MGSQCVAPATNVEAHVATNSSIGSKMRRRGIAIERWGSKPYPGSGDAMPSNGRPGTGSGGLSCVTAVVRRGTGALIGPNSLIGISIPGPTSGSE